MGSRGFINLLQSLVRSFATILFELFDLSASLDNDKEIISPNCVDIVYEKIITALKPCDAIAVPLRRKNFFKFWWSQELDCLKDSAIDSDKLWKAAGRPRSGSLYDRRFADKRAYRAAIRKNQRESEDVFSNDLHDALCHPHTFTVWTPESHDSYPL